MHSYITVRTKRPKIRPNQGFWNQLGTYERRLAAKKETAEPIVSSGLNESWARESSAMFATCRGIELENLADICFESLRDPDIDKKQALLLCLDFIWGRGVLAVEVDWLVAASRVLDESVPEPACADLILRELTDPSSEFQEQWEGEIYPEHVEMVLKCLEIPIQNET